MLERLKGMVIQEVPEELSVCEFDCPMATCTASNWVTCPLRCGNGNDRVAVRAAADDAAGLDIFPPVKMPL